ncbi:hypothetical protein [Ectothiorhodospira variabilis]|uniref:hypothetical protein n=1 Tax=Ectothiorhodospira variabilis TaxID=505694 RepID=UPI001EFACDBA|nr:hypothetical protein [Ectothiorhodospira variabilis]MCG5497801.1 hypothetical protein [Ectothiorhodospira variabilis]
MEKFFLMLGVGLASVYMFPSGQPQITDLFLVIFSVLILGHLVINKKPLIGREFIGPLLVLVMWIFIVQLSWSFFVPEISLLHPLYYLFNLVIIFALIQFMSRRSNSTVFLLKLIQISLVISGLGLLLQIVGGGILGYAATPARLTGFFNNPNQLAYFSLCALGAILVLQRFHMEFRPLSVAALISGTLGAIAPTSLAAWGGLLLLIFAVLIANWRNIGGVVRLALPVPIIFISFLYLDQFQEGVLTDRIAMRIDRMETKIDDIEGERNYERILAFPQYWVLGAGEGVNDRFAPYKVGEIHSSLGNVFFSYGVVGFGLLILVFWRALRGTPIEAWIAFGAPMLYGLTHMGLRSTMFWIFLMLIWYQYNKCRRNAGSAVVSRSGRLRANNSS